ncbi:MAG: hypothetical protein OES24_08515 [Acidimicrobiia bacterium]|nr:hypothetical protein [Acidimicrobiia bacterium]
MSTLTFEPVVRGRRHLHLRYRVGGFAFTTTYWYDTVDFGELEERYGSDQMRRIEFHLLAFEANKALSLKPATVDFGPYADLVTKAFWEIWETVFHNVWAVWRYENDLPDYKLPAPQPAPNADIARVTVPVGDTPTLMLCGGGKDSLTSMKLLERGGIPYDAFVYSHSTYGRGSMQHELIDGLLASCTPGRVHRAWVIDDGLDAPVVTVHPQLGLRRMIAAETVSSYFQALPLALAHGYTDVALGISRSTDEHNLTWDATGEDVNYLWGMSSIAEQRIHDYIRSHLASNVAVFHILRPIYDVNVFALLNRDLASVPATHSCAQLKPWCCRCAKCIYVWMNYVAWLPVETVAATFEKNLFEIPENRTLLRKMLGLESYKPVDCVGTVSEARLAFLMCRRKGVSGPIADDIDLGPFKAEAAGVLDKYRAVAPLASTMPERIGTAIEPQLAESARRAAAIAASVLDIDAG